MAQGGGPQHIPRPPEWRPGEPPAWLDYRATPLGVADVERALAGFEPREIDRGVLVGRPERPGRRSAVLVPLYDHDSHGLTTILTRRPLHMRKHAGEVAFPGGAVDDDDPTVWDTALREAEEEIALDPTLPRRLGELDRFVTGASFSLVTPVVAALPSRPVGLRPSPDEVDEILDVPLSALLVPDAYRQELWTWQGEERAVHFFEIEGDTIWGATAFMLLRLLEVVTTS
ncbi:MAG: NUDIX hydrolase [Acidimicrobiales bacterium]